MDVTSFTILVWLGGLAAGLLGSLTGLGGGVVIVPLLTLIFGVDREYDRLQATMVAGRIRGVKGVVNNLTVDWDRGYGDGALMSKIVDRMNSDFVLASVKDKIKVAVDQGRVTLTGTVYNWGERREADRVASETPGVRSIDNRLEVPGYKYAWSDGH